jgi:peptide-methionine (S)-S-oxide reductase
MLPEPRDATATNRLETATFGAGCFWCTEAVFESIPGVISATSGYMGGTVKNPTYQAVCTGRTGHAEVTQLRFDASVVTFEKLLEVFWSMHDPTTLNRQGADEGSQYRSVVFYHSESQKSAVERSLADLKKNARFRDPIVTQVVAAGDFYAAEDNHQDYFRNNADAPYCRLVIVPKLKKLGIPTTRSGQP